MQTRACTSRVRVEYYLPMSRREATVDTFLGALLVLLFGLYFVLCVAAAWLGFEALVLVARYLRPQTVITKDGLILVLFLYFAASFLVSGIKQLRAHRWRNAFLSLAIFPAMLSIWLADAHSRLGHSNSFGILAILPIVAVSTKPLATRFDFFAGAATACAVVAINAGLLGSGSLASIVTICVLVGAFVWFAKGLRQNWSDPKNSAPPSPLSPTRA
jgi:hypothetical protein